MAEQTPQLQTEQLARSCIQQQNPAPLHVTPPPCTDPTGSQALATESPNTPWTSGKAARHVTGKLGEWGYRLTGDRAGSITG
ncbi:hypothetical protein [Streptomyces sp. HUAS TT7]|uniref:hypothetical protein n=1 Tax=Streptomyces sp. HUAS TT7 TaxID=3447507 RepID=UPI003F6605FC